MALSDLASKNSIVAVVAGIACGFTAGLFAVRAYFDAQQASATAARAELSAAIEAQNKTISALRLRLEESVSANDLQAAQLKDSIPVDQLISTKQQLDTLAAENANLKGNYPLDTRKGLG